VRFVPRPSRRGRGPLAALVLVALALAGCTSSETPTAPPAGPVTSPVTGVPIDIDTEGFSKVTAFTIRTADGREQMFEMGTLENGVEFPPNHLAEHLAASTWIRVFFRTEDGEDVVYRLEDAEPPS
jgi:hypothetical protein